LLKNEPGLVFEEKKTKLGLVKFAQFIFRSKQRHRGSILSGRTRASSSHGILAQ